MRTNRIKLLHKECSEFEKLLREARLMTVGLKGATQKIVSGLSELKTVLQLEPPCSICFENVRKYATSCGHLMCEPCMRRLDRETPRRCYHCRSEVTSIIKVYL